MMTLLNIPNFTTAFVKKDFDQLREHLLNRLIVLLALLHFPAIGLITVRGFWFNHWTLNNIIQLSLYGFLLLFVWQYQRLPYLWRVGLFVGLWWISGFANLFFMGSVMDSPLIIVSLLTALLLPIWVSGFMIVVVVFAICGIGIAVTGGYWKFEVDYYAFISHPLNWIVSAYYFVGYAGVIIYTVGQMIHALRVSLEQAQKQTRQLQETQSIAKLGSWYYQPTQDLFTGSDEAYRLFGLVPNTPFNFNDFLEQVVPADRQRVSETFQHFLETGESYQNEYQIKINGKFFWISARVNSYRDQQGQISEIFGTVQDITKYKRIEQELRTRQEKFERLAATIPGMLYDSIVYPDGSNRFLYVSPRCHEILEVESEALLNDSHFFWQMIHPDDFNEFVKFDQEISQQNPYFNRQIRVITPSGKLKWLEFSSRPNLPEPDQLPVWSGYVRDITEQKQAEEALYQSEKLFRLAFENASVGMCLVDLQGRLLKVNSRLCEMFGYSEQELEGMSVNEIAYPEDHAISTEFIQKAITTPDHKGSFEKRYRHQQGQLVWGFVSSALVESAQGRPLYFISHVHDITQRKEMEETLRMAEQFYRATIDALSAHLCVLNEQGTILAVNQTWREFALANPPVPTHYEEGTNYLEICDKASCDLTAPEARLVATGIRDVLQGQQKYFTLEYPCHSPNEERWFTVRVSRFSSSNAVRAVVTHENITERKLAEKALRDSEQRYRSLVSAMSEGVVLQNRQGEIVTCNHAAEQILGLTQQQMMGRTSLDSRWQSIHEDGSPFRGEDHPGMIVLRTGQAQHHVIMGIHKPDGQLSWILINAEPLFQTTATEPEAVVVTFTDITERKQTEFELEQQRRTLQAVLDNIPVAVQVFANPSGETILANNRAVELLGRPIEPETTIDQLNQIYGVFIHGTDQPYPPERMPLVRGLAGETSMVEDMELRHPDGSQILLQVIGSPIYDETGKISASVVIFQDISQRKQAEIALRESEQRFIRLFMEMPIPLCFVNNRGELIYFNHHFAEVFGYTHEEIPTLTEWWQLAYPDEIYRHWVLETWNAAVTKAFEQKTEIEPLEYEVTCKNGTKRIMFIGGITLEDNFLATFVDMTERKQAEERIRASEQQLRRLGDNLPFGTIHQVVHTVDGQIYFSYISAGIQRILGITPEQVMTSAKVLYDLIHPEDQLGLQMAETESARMLQPLDYIARHYTVTGEIRWLHIRSLPYRKNDGSTWWDGFAMDITTQKQVETELIRARQAAETANQAKSAFLANMSHELRTPLNAILGFAQILIKDAKLSEIQYNQVHSILNGGEYLLTLINDILDLAKIEAGRFELVPQSWNTHSFFQELTHLFQIRAEQKEIVFRYEVVTDLPHTLYCDDKRLRQILINLVGNAIKFTEHGSVTLRSSFADKRLWLEVIDTGVGILSSELEKIFEPFRQTGENRYKVQGTGLGLAITHRLVETMNGHLSVNSVIGTGSVFRVEIPVEVVSTFDEVRQPLDKPIVISYHRRQGKGPLKLLVVDDIIDNREVLRYLLESLGFAIAEAENGWQCLEVAQMWQPDLIFMDLRMPEMDGLETIRRLRTLPFFQTIPIIVVSASMFTGDHEQSQAAGCNAHLGKPVRLEELLDTLERLLPLKWNHAPLVSTENPTMTLERLLPEQNSHFQYLVKCGDITSLQELVEQLQQVNCCPVFVRMLTVLVKNFDLKGLKQLAKHYDHFD